MHGLEVCEHAAEPTEIHVRLATTSGFGCNWFLCLFFGTDEQHRTTVGHGLAHEAVRAIDARQRLVQVDDVDAGAFAVQEPFHFRVPTASLVPEMDPRVE